MAGFGGPGSGGWEAEILALTWPVDWQVLQTNELVGCQLGWLLPLKGRLDDVRGQVRDSKDSREVGSVEAIRGGEIGDCSRRTGFKGLTPVVCSA